MEDEEQTTNDANGADIPEEQAIEQQIVPFMGDNLAAALATGGNIYITLPGMCNALGLILIRIPTYHLTSAFLAVLAREQVVYRNADWYEYARPTATHPTHTDSL